MTKISDLSNLFHALSAEDWQGARVVAENIASAEERAGHHGAATRLRGALSSTGPRADSESRSLSIPAFVGAPEILSRLPDASLDDIELTKSARSLINEVLKEHRHRTRLLANDLRPRARLFFFGPPGCGKTITARALGASLGVPTFVVRFDALVGSYLGQTSIRLREVFRFAESHPSVIVIDEIDAVGRHRGRTADVGEMDRIVISLMQQLELVQPAAMLIAASNLAEHLDPALLRRFDVALEFPRPSRGQLAVFAQHQAKARKVTLGKATQAAVSKAETFADVEKLIESEHRRAILRNV
ncbi:MAG: AAA family ATPase [Kofleriaceae bacterium]